MIGGSDDAAPAEENKMQAQVQFDPLNKIDVLFRVKQRNTSLRAEEQNLIQLLDIDSEVTVLVWLRHLGGA
jgi:hypothetical protein